MVSEFTSVPIDAEAQAPANTPTSVITLGRFFVILAVTLVAVATIFVVLHDSPDQLSGQAYQEHGGEVGPALSRYLHGAAHALEATNQVAADPAGTRRGDVTTDVTTETDYYGDLVPVETEMHFHFHHIKVPKVIKKMSNVAIGFLKGKCSTLCKKVVSLLAKRASGSVNRVASQICGQAVGEVDALGGGPENPVADALAAVIAGTCSIEIRKLWNRYSRDPTGLANEACSAIVGQI